METEVNAGLPFGTQTEEGVCLETEVNTGLPFGTQTGQRSGKLTANSD